MFAEQTLILLRNFICTILLAGQVLAQDAQIIEQRELADGLIREKLLLQGWDPTDPVPAVAIYPKGKTKLPLWFCSTGFRTARRQWNLGHTSWRRGKSLFWPLTFIFTVKEQWLASSQSRTSHRLGTSMPFLSIKFRSHTPPVIFPSSWRVFKTAQKLTFRALA